MINDWTVWKVCYKKMIEVKDLCGGQYFINKNIKFKTPMPRSDLCDYSDAYIVVKGIIYFLAAAANEK